MSANQIGIPGAALASPSTSYGGILSLDQGYGVAASNTAALNTTLIAGALAQAAAQGGGLIELMTPGTYTMLDTFTRPANTQLLLGPGITLQVAGGGAVTSLLAIIARQTGLALDSSGNVIGLVAPSGLTIAFSQILAQSGIPFIKPSSGSIANNGALTGLTALAITYSDGCYMYFAASQIFAGSLAGWYWTVMSSTTAGTIFNNVYSVGQPTIPAANTAFVSTGPGAFAGLTTAITAVNASLNGGALGNNGEITFEAVDQQNNSAGTKSMNAVIGGTTFNNLSATTSIAPNSARWIVRNRGQKNRQMYHFNFGGEPTYQSGSVGTQSIDTSVTQIVGFTLQCAVATDWVSLEGYSIQMIPGA